MAELHRRLFTHGYSVANDGNSSVRIEKNRVLITPSGLEKSSLRPHDMVVIDLNGKVVAGKHLPSSELLLHLGVYCARPDIKAIIHAHPPYAIAASLAGISLSAPILPEVVLTIGTIPTTPYAAPGTKETAQMVAEFSKHHEVMVLDRHGTVTMGTSLEAAMMKLERLEHAAKVISLAQAMGNVTPLPDSEMKRLLQQVGKETP